VVQVGGDVGALQRGAVAAQEVVRAVRPGRQLHVAHRRAALPHAQREALAVDQEAARPAPAPSVRSCRLRAGRRGRRERLRRLRPTWQRRDG